MRKVPCEVKRVIITEIANYSIMLGIDSENTRGYSLEGPLIFWKVLILITTNSVAMEIRRAIEKWKKVSIQSFWYSIKYHGFFQICDYSCSDFWSPWLQRI